jgi:ankyrin repeat protein
MGQSMLLKYLVTRLDTEGSSNPFLSTISRIAEEFGSHQSRERNMEGAMLLFTATIAHLGSGLVANRLIRKRELDVASILKSSSVAHPAALAIAVVLGNSSKVRKLLNEGADPDHGNEFGLPLVIASNTGQFQIVQLLLEHGVDVNNGIQSLVRPGMSPACALHAAALTGNEKLLRLILKAKYGSVSCHVDYERAIYYAAEGGHEDVVWFLIDRCTHFSSVLHVKSNVMIEGAKAGQVGIVRMLLDHGIDANVTYYGDGASALQLSSSRGHLQVVRVLLENGAEARLSGQSATNPLVQASRNGHLDVMKLLLQFGSSVDIKTWNECLRQAVREGHLGTVRFCLESGADVSINEETILPTTSDHLGYTLLYLASLASHFDVLRLLVKEYGINPNGAGDPAQNGESPMLTGLIMGNEKLVRVMLSLGASRVDVTRSCMAHRFATGEFPLGRLE